MQLNQGTEGSLERKEQNAYSSELMLFSTLSLVVSAWEPDVLLRIPPGAA